MLTPDPSLKNATAVNDDVPNDSSTTMFDAVNEEPDTFCSLWMNPSLSVTSSDSVSDAELPWRRTVILGTSPARAGLKLGAADGLKVGLMVGELTVGLA